MRGRRGGQCWGRLLFFFFRNGFFGFITLMVKSERTCSQWQRRRTKSPSPHWLTPPRSRTAARWPIQEARQPNSVEIVSSLVDRRRLLLLLSVLLLPCSKVRNKMSCTSESRADTETHGKGKKGGGGVGAAGERPD